MSSEEREIDGEALAKYRPCCGNVTGLSVVPMTEEQIYERRSYLRKTLRNFPQWENLPNKEFDKIRMFALGDKTIVEDSNGYEFILPDDRITSAESDFRSARAMMPFAYMNLMGKDFLWDKYKTDISECKEFINQYIVKYPRFKEKGKGLYIYSGTKGSGKTMLACCLLNEICRRHAGSVKFINILDFLEITKKGFKGEETELAGIYEAGLLVLDDIGVQMSKEWVETILYRLVDHRYTRHLPTIYTSNIPIEGLRMDGRITDRIESTTYPVKIPEESIRKEMMRKEKQQLLDEIKNAP